MREDLELEYLGLCGGTTTQQRATSSPTLEQGEFSILTALMDFPNIIVGVTKYVGLDEVKLWTLETEVIVTHTSRVHGSSGQGMPISVFHNVRGKRIWHSTHTVQRHWHPPRRNTIVNSRRRS